MRLLTIDDFIDLYTKAHQRGIGFLFSKLNPSGIERTRSAFSDTASDSANWWIIPEVKRRWNRLITGNPDINFKQHLMTRCLQDASGLRMLSIGSGTCSHEVELAAYPQFKEIQCLDIAANLLRQGEEKARARGISNMEFICSPLEKFSMDRASYDLIMFHSSLHHFRNVEKIVEDHVVPRLVPGGMVVINEYVGPNRLQIPPHQREAINECLQLLPVRYRRRYKTGLVKRRFHGSGYLRMILADPSECVDSESILPAMHNHFTSIMERPYGGNILLHVLKDIAHHFVHPDEEATDLLKRLFDYEDKYLMMHPSDMVFGIYKSE